MNNQHPITPTPELIAQCIEMFKSGTRMEDICRVAAQWGADQELEACCECLRQEGAVSRIWFVGSVIAMLESGSVRWPWQEDVARLRDARRAKPPSLKKQALALLDKWNAIVDLEEEEEDDLNADIDTIRQALEALPNDN